MLLRINGLFKRLSTPSGEDGGKYPFHKRFPQNPSGCRSKNVLVNDVWGKAVPEKKNPSKLIL